MSKYVQRVKHSFETDITYRNGFSLLKRGGRALPSATAEYLLDKVPIVGWLPKYNWRWIPNDIIAGITLGIMLIPQSLAYASIATIPVQFGLMSSWLPSLLYAFMGTTKGTRHLTDEAERQLTTSRSLHRPYLSYRLAHR